MALRRSLMPYRGYPFLCSEFLTLISNPCERVFTAVYVRRGNFLRCLTSPKLGAVNESFTVTGTQAGNLVKVAAGKISLRRNQNWIRLFFMRHFSEQV